MLVNSNSRIRADKRPDLIGMEFNGASCVARVLSTSYHDRRIYRLEEFEGFIKARMVYCSKGSGGDILRRGEISWCPFKDGAWLRRKHFIGANPDGSLLCHIEQARINSDDSRAGK